MIKKYIVNYKKSQICSLDELDEVVHLLPTKTRKVKDNECININDDTIEIFAKKCKITVEYDE